MGSSMQSLTWVDQTEKTKGEEWAQCRTRELKVSGKGLWLGVVSEDSDPGWGQGGRWWQEV